MSKLQEGNVASERVYTVEEIAKLARISRTGAYELIKKEYFPVIRVGNPLGYGWKESFYWPTLPKREQKKRAIWNAETIRRALDACEDDRLYLAIPFAFA